MVEHQHPFVEVSGSNPEWYTKIYLVDYIYIAFTIMIYQVVTDINTKYILCEGNLTGKMATIQGSVIGSSPILRSIIYTW